MLVVTVDNRARLPRDALPQRVRELLCARFVHQNPEHRRQEAAGRKNHGEPPTYRTWRAEGDELTFPRGGLRRVREVLRAAGIEFSIGDGRRGGERDLFIPDHRLTLYPYQEAAVTALLAKENCLLRAPTGSGKTTVGFAIVGRLKLPTLVIVWSKNLMDQWVARAERELGCSVGIVGGGKFSLAPVTVAMQQTVHQVLREGGARAQALKEFAVVICDEVQRFAADTLFDTVDPLPARYRIGISADEQRKDSKEFLIYDLFGKVAADIPRQQLVDSGHVLEVEICVVPTQFKAPWYRYRTDFNRLLEQMRGDTARNQLALGLARAEVAAGEQVLLFSHRVEHCRELDQALSGSGVRSGVMIGGKPNEAMFREAREGILSGDLRAAVGTVQAIGQGLDLPAVSRGIVVTPLANNRQQFGQVRGRVCRTSSTTGKTDARMFYLLDQHVYGRKALQNLVQWNPIVRVLHGGEWIDAKQYLRGISAGRAAAALFNGGSS